MLTSFSYIRIRSNAKVNKNFYYTFEIYLNSLILSSRYKTLGFLLVPYRIFHNKSWTLLETKRLLATIWSREVMRQQIESEKKIRWPNYDGYVLLSIKALFKKVFLLLVLSFTSESIRLCVVTLSHCCHKRVCCCHGAGKILLNKTSF